LLDKAPGCRRCRGAAVWYFSHKFAWKAAPKVTPLSSGTIQLGPSVKQRKWNEAQAKKKRDNANWQPA
ncbi:MAG: hypothetical protein ACRYGH_27075, partial [Janthinobacterium lividum]